MRNGILLIDIPKTISSSLFFIVSIYLILNPSQTSKSKRAPPSSDLSPKPFSLIMPPPPDVSSYRLSDAQSQEIFIKEILPIEFPDDALPTPTTSGSRPLAVLTVGQTGAGKTILAPSILEALKSSRPAHFIADTYKTYHPEYMRLMLSNPNLASPAAGFDARKWLAMAAKEAVRRRRNVVLESACRHPDDFCELARIFRDADYRLEVLVLAVPEALSRLGILTRFYERRPEGQSRNLPVRLTPVKVHDDSYIGLLHAAKFLDESKVADQVIVLRRGNLVAYGIEGDRGGGGIADAVARERERPLSKGEMSIALEDLQNLSIHEDASDQVIRIRQLLQPLISNEAVIEPFPALRLLELGTPGNTEFNVLCLGGK